MTPRHQQLEDLVTDENLGVTIEYDDPSRPDKGGRSTFPNGDSAVNCTNCAWAVAKKIGIAHVGLVFCGWEAGDNPEALIASPDGHDFLIVDDRYLVDAWAKLVESVVDRSVYDLDNRTDRQEVLRRYGPPFFWHSGQVQEDESILWSRESFSCRQLMQSTMKLTADILQSVEISAAYRTYKDLHQFSDWEYALARRFFEDYQRTQCQVNLLTEVGLKLGTIAAIPMSNFFRGVSDLLQVFEASDHDFTFGDTSHSLIPLSRFENACEDLFWGPETGTTDEVETLRQRLTTVKTNLGDVMVDLSS